MVKLNRSLLGALVGSLLLGAAAFAQEKEAESAVKIDPMDLTGQSRQMSTLLEGYYNNALGGSLNWAEVQSVRFHGVLELPQGLVEFIAFKKKPQYCKVVLFGANDLRVVMATDGEDSWQLMTNDAVDVVDMPKADAINFVRDATIGGHLLYSTLVGKQIELAGTERIDAELCYHLKVTLPDQQVVEYFLDATDYVERRQVVTNAVSGQREVTNHFEHRDVHGLKIPFRSVMSVDGEQVHAVRLLDVDVNSGVTSWMFGRDSATYVPKAGRAVGRASQRTAVDLSTPVEGSGMESQFKMPEIDDAQRKQLLRDIEIEL
ncbi:MAG: hypothetical protein ACPGJU_06905 [Coraliomargarita sp.]